LKLKSTFLQSQAVGIKAKVEPQNAMISKQLDWRIDIATRQVDANSTVKPILTAVSLL
jgi:hypothetical protein